MPNHILTSQDYETNKVIEMETNYRTSHEKLHIYYWGFAVILFTILFRNWVIEFKWWTYLILVMLIFIIGSFITSGAYDNPEYGGSR